MATPTLHLVGPGGAGKSSVGPLLSQRLGWQFIDLDTCFLAQEGDIGSFIAAFGCTTYAKRNVDLYKKYRHSQKEPTVFALSSGFFAYPNNIDPHFPSLLKAIETDALTSLLLPTFEIETCTAIIVQRQLSRPYLSGNAANETQRIRERFPLYTALQCAHFLSHDAPELIASRIAQFARGVLPQSR